MDTPEHRTHTGAAAAGTTLDLVICGVDELTRFRRCGCTHVVSIMDPGSDVPTVFGSFNTHERLDLRFHDIIDPDVDMIVPDSDHIGQILRFGRSMLASKSPVKLLAHCHAGVSRSSAAAALMLTVAQPGTPAQALGRLLSIAPNAWPNLRMIELGDALLGCNGQLIAAVRVHYANMIERYPVLRQMVAADKHLRATRE